MSLVYAVESDGSTRRMKRLRCVNEDRELQRLLERSLDLRPGDQISPDDPRRWILIKREMPVPDPSTGSDRWSIDFLLADQNAVPTFVECKRYNDTRSRREVVGQVFEYAANGQYYWTRDQLRAFAEDSAKQNGSTLDQALDAFQIDETNSDEDFFTLLEENLREGQVRIVFFLEEAPWELKSVVDFLNSQMERSEVLIVEARQFRLDGTTVVVPTLFGFTEEARRVKRRVNIVTGARKKWNEESFFTDATARLSAQDLTSIQEVYDYAKSSSYDLSWGSGANHGSFQVKLPPVCSTAARSTRP